MRVGRWHVAIIAGFVAVLWTCQLLELIDAVEFLVFYSSVCLAVSLGSWLWMVWRARIVTPSGTLTSVAGHLAGLRYLCIGRSAAPEWRVVMANRRPERPRKC